MILTGLKIAKKISLIQHFTKGGICRSMQILITLGTHLITTYLLDYQF